MEGADGLSTPRQQPQRQLSTPSAPAAAHRLRSHRTTFSAALGSAQRKSGTAEQQRAAAYSAALERLVQQMEDLQAWLQSTPEGRELSPEDARITVDALERVEECLESMETSLSGGVPNTCAQLLRRADKEEAMQANQLHGGAEEACSPQVRELLHGLASSVARTAARLAQGLRAPAPEVLARLQDDDTAEQYMQQIRWEARSCCHASARGRPSQPSEMAHTRTPNPNTLTPEPEPEHPNPNPNTLPKTN